MTQNRLFNTQEGQSERYTPNVGNSISKQPFMGRGCCNYVPYAGTMFMVALLDSTICRHRVTYIINSGTYLRHIVAARYYNIQVRSPPYHAVMTHWMIHWEVRIFVSRKCVGSYRGNKRAWNRSMSRSRCMSFYCTPRSCRWPYCR